MMSQYFILFYFQKLFGYDYPNIKFSNYSPQICAMKIYKTPLSLMSGQIIFCYHLIYLCHSIWLHWDKPYLAWSENNLTLTTTHGINLENHTNQFKVYFFSMQCEVQENNTLLLILVLWTHIKADLHEVLIWGADKALLIWGADLHEVQLKRAAEADSCISAEIGNFLIFCNATFCLSFMWKMQLVWMSL